MGKSPSATVPIKQKRQTKTPGRVIAGAVPVLYLIQTKSVPHRADSPYNYLDTELRPQRKEYPGAELNCSRKIDAARNPLTRAGSAAAGKWPGASS